MRGAGAETVEGTTAVRGKGAGTVEGPAVRGAGAETVEGPGSSENTPTASSSAPRSSSPPLLHRLASCRVVPLRSLPG